MLKRGRRMSGRLLLVSILPGRGTRSRLGLVVSRKVGSAVIRNRLRRRLREIFRRSLRQALEGGQRIVDVVIQARPGAGTASWDELRDELAAGLRRLGEGSRPGRTP